MLFSSPRLSVGLSVQYSMGQIAPHSHNFRHAHLRGAPICARVDPTKFGSVGLNAVHDNELGGCRRGKRVAAVARALAMSMITMLLIVCSGTSAAVRVRFHMSACACASAGMEEQRCSASAKRNHQSL